MRLSRSGFRPGPALRTGLVLFLLHLGVAPCFSLSLEEMEVIAPRGTERGLLAPQGFVYDTYRGLFIVANTEAHRVDLLSREGDSFKIMGRAGNLRRPRTVAAGKDSTLFVAMQDSEIIKVLSQYDSGVGEEFHDLNLSAYRQRAAVQAIALDVDREGNLYVVDRGNRQVLVLDRQQRFRFALADIGDPSDVAVGANTIYVADPGFGGIRVYDGQGRRLRTLGADPGRFPTPLRAKALAVDRRERLWVLEEANLGLKVFDTFGNLLLDYPFSQGGRLAFLSAVDLTLDADRFLYVLEQGTGLIRVFRINEF
ncbi:MAG: hypothetical protein A2505_08710 [Deltaproteobacteria bacterium RIFOXYD12_FULL_55_16]|nr:MAG: hypothetical protein A2505_08710 [Deltaproteobacteria bacterium RIFOXYD12_FULL_55_16]